MRLKRLQAVPWGFVTLVVGYAAALVAVAPVDYDWTIYLTEHRLDPEVTMMRGTLFEGDWPGASDIPIFAALAMLVLYLRATTAGASPRWRRSRPSLGFGVVAMLAAGLGAVHALKWVIGRARPYSVLTGEHLPYTPWYRAGPHFVTEGIYRGSFPSGHTAAAFAFIVVAYALAADPLLSRRWRAVGWAFGALTVAFSAVMAVASSMARSHWLSDSVGVVGLVWILVHALYFWVLRVPDQRRYDQTHGPIPLPSYWELGFCWRGFLVLLGLIAVGLGLRALWIQPVPYLSALVPVGVGLVAYFGPSTWQYIERLHALLRPQRAGS